MGVQWRRWWQQQRRRRNQGDTCRYSAPTLMYLTDVHRRIRQINRVIMTTSRAEILYSLNNVPADIVITAKSGSFTVNVALLAWIVCLSTAAIQRLNVKIFAHLWLVRANMMMVHTNRDFQCRDHSVTYQYAPFQQTLLSGMLFVTGQMPYFLATGCRTFLPATITANVSIYFSKQLGDVCRSKYNFSHGH